MRTLTIVALVTLAIGTYPAYAHRIVTAAQTLVCNIIPVPYQPAVTFAVILVAIVALVQGKSK